MNTFPLRSDTRQRCLSTLTTSIQDYTVGFQPVNKSRKRSKRHPDWKVQVKPFIQRQHCHLCRKSYGFYLEKQLELINVFNKLQNATSIYKHQLHFYILAREKIGK